MQYRELENIVVKNSKDYYTTGKQKISDETFDALVEKIQKENPNSDILTTGWGYKVESKNKHKHIYGKLGSLKKVRSWSEILNSLFDEKDPKRNSNSLIVDISAKLDGISVALYFNKGKLYLALTRGDGYEGINVTEKLLFILRNDTLYKDFTGAVRGEILMNVEDFNEYKKLHPEAKNPRNSVAGLMNSDSITNDFFYLKFYAYSVIGIEDYSEYLKMCCIDDPTFTDQLSMNRWLNYNFNYVAPRVLCKIDSSNYEQVLNNFKSIWEKTLNIDGIVISQNTLNMSKNMTGEILYNQVAYKFQEDVAISEVRSLEWNISKNGRIVPVINIDPVELAGTTVSRANGFNARYIKEKEIGVGSIVSISKRGEIIPVIKDVINKSDNISIPKKCWICGEDLKWSSSGADLLCSNFDCKNSINKHIEAICLNLAPTDNIKWTTIFKYLNLQGFQNIYTVLDAIEFLFSLPHKDYSKNSDEKSLFNNMLYNLHNTDKTISQFLLALNIPGLGKISADRWENLREFNGNKITGFDVIDFVYSGVYKPLSFTIMKDYILPYITQDKSVVELLLDDNSYKILFRSLYDKIRNKILSPERDNIKNGEVVITGKLSISRSEFEQKLKEKGWELKSAITNHTNYLITNSPNSNTSKNKKADELGIQKITEKDFIEKYF